MLGQVRQTLEDWPESAVLVQRLVCELVDPKSFRECGHLAFCDIAPWAVLNGVGFLDPVNEGEELDEPVDEVGAAIAHESSDEAQLVAPSEQHSAHEGDGGKPDHLQREVGVEGVHANEHALAGTFRPCRGHSQSRRRRRSWTRPKRCDV